MKTTCRGPECDREVKARGLCAAHYSQWKRGSHLKPIRVKRAGCGHPGCDRPFHAKGYCATHCTQFYKYGKTFDVGALYHQAKGGHHTIEQFFWARVAKSPGCWEWTGAKFNKSGYGYVMREGHRQVAHRLSYKLNKGPVPEGLQVDHRCHNRLCVRPDHLRLATPSQNSQNRKGARSDSTTGIRGATKNGTGFSASVVVDGVVTWLGTFATPEEAGEVARAGRLEHYTHNDRDRIDESCWSDVLHGADVPTEVVER